MSGPVPSGREPAPPASPASIESLSEYFRAAGKPRSAWRIGVEQEKIAVFDGGGPVPFAGDRGVEGLLRALVKRGFTPITEQDRLLALSRRGERITVEPGGQVELSGRVLGTAAACHEELVEHVRAMQDAARPLGLRFLGLGFHPFASLDELPWLPRSRYELMRTYLPTRGRLGHRMMKQTATVQVNFDYQDEASAMEKMRAAFGVTSIVTGLFAASPITEGRPNGHQSYRAAIWLDTDEDRCGLLPFVFEEGASFRHYVTWALDVPMFFLVRGGRYHSTGGMTFRRFLAEGWNGESATSADWETHLSTLFPEVRLKQYIEVRGADAGPMEMAAGLAALWRGLLDDAEARAAAWSLVRGASMSEREELRRAVPRAGMRTRFLGRSLQELAVELCRIAAAGLARLPSGAGDLPLLEPLAARAASGRSVADDMLADLEAAKGDQTKLVDRWELNAG